MARKPMVTRTLTYTNCELLVININDSEVDNGSKPYVMEYKMLRKHNNDFKLLKHIKNVFASETPHIVPLKVLKVSYSQELKGMTEEEFSSLARTLTHY